jgi:hypothetical protein
MFDFSFLPQNPVLPVNQVQHDLLPSVAVAENADNYPPPPPK